MTIFRVPYHLDEYLADLALPAAAAGAHDVTVELSDADLWARLVRLYDHVADAIAPTARAGSLPVVVSGDCTVSIGLTTGLQRAGLDPSIVWMDAHGDVQTLETTPSGYLGGMALRFLLGYRPDRLAGPLGLRPTREDRAVLVDARDLDPDEVDFLAASALKRVTLPELSPDVLPAGPLLFNVDLDTLDPDVLPGLRYPAPGGPGLPALLGAIDTVLGSGRVAAVNIACTWHSGRDDADGIHQDVVSAVLAGLPERAKRP